MQRLVQCTRPVPGFPIRFAKTPGSVRRGAPLAGQNTIEVLKAFGFTDDRIASLVESGVVLDSEKP